IPCARLIHSVESLSLVQQIEARAEATVDVLLEVNVSGETTKYGILPADAEAFLERAAPYKAVRFVGLMTMAPFVHDADDVRPVFRRLRELRDRLAPRFAPRYPLTELSMGMSNDYEVAVEEGATLVRLGSTLFSRAQGG
ncbi:MAG: alanine racemase, partial [Thermoleophilia bacterium]|nr:alanine racemase [Thermoleophilia bacterium]